jgi:2-desacetyl-2-hydroxyethyl bacteriochlorophyllide A dehydrogenase
MKTAILQNPGSLAWVESPEPAASADSALVRVLRCGVCGTDIHAITGKQPFFSYPRRLGHELCVEVIEAPPDSGLNPGDRCAVEPYLFCGSCPACRIGRTNCCRGLQVMGVHIDGGHAPRIGVPVDKLHVSSRLSPDELALVEPLVIGAHGIERAALRTGEPTLIIGLGPIGLAAALFARAAGANCLCVDTQPSRVDYAHRQLGLRACQLAGGDLKEQTIAHFGQMPAAVIDATGNPASMEAAFDLPEHGGRIVFIGLFIGSVSFDDPSFHRRELTLLASRAGLPGTFNSVIDLLERKQIDALPLITHRMPFDSIVDRLPGIHREPGLVKAMIDFQPGS